MLKDITIHTCQSSCSLFKAIFSHPLDDDPIGGLFEDETENVNSLSHIGSIDQTYGKKYYDIKFMTLQHTLAFCFLGLLWLQEPVCLSDLIRWLMQTVYVDTSLVYSKNTALVHVS